MIEYHDEMNKWEHFSELRLCFSKLILESNSQSFYRFIHNELEKLTHLNVVVVLSDSITYSQHIAITNESTYMRSWHNWFDKLAGEGNTQNLRAILWQNKGSVTLDTTKDVAGVLFRSNCDVKNLPIKSWFSTPIIWGEDDYAKIVGSIIIYSKDKENENKELYDVNFIEHFSKHLAILFKNKRIFDRDKALVKTARNLYFETKQCSSFDEIINNVLVRSYEYAKELMNVADFLAFVVPAKYISFSSEPQLCLSYKKGKKTENNRANIFSELARYIIEHPQERLLLQNKAEVEEKLSCICQDLKGIKLPETLIVVPMGLGTNEARGAFIIYHMGHKNAYDEDDYKVIDRLSDQAALAIDAAYSQQLKERTHRERHKALFDMNNVLFKFDSSHLKKDEAIQEVLKIAIKHINKVGINVENVSIFTKHFQNRADLEDETNKPNLQLVHYKDKFISNFSKNNLQPYYIEAAALHVINNPETPLLFKNKNNFKESGLSIGNDENIPFSFLAIPIRLEENLASGAFIFCTDSEYTYDMDDLQFIDDITDSVALIIKNIVMRIEKEKVLFDMSRTLLCFVKMVGEKSNEEIIEKILTTSCQHTQKLAKADNMMIYMSHVDDDSNEKTSLQLRKSFENGKDIAVNKAKKLIPIELIEYVVNHPKTPIIWGSIEDALKKIKELNLSIKSSYIPKSLLIVPMSLEIDNPAKGAFILYDFYSTHRYENEDKDFVDELSDQVAIIIQNLLLNHTKQELEASNDKLSKSLIGVSQQLMSKINLSEDEVANKVHDIVDETMDANNMYIAYYNEKKETIRFPLFYENGTRRKVNERGFSNGRTEWIIANNNQLIIYTKNESIQWYKQAGFESIGNPLASWIGAPISSGNKIFGVLAFFHPEKDNAYDETDLKILTSLANQIAITMDNSRIYKELQDANHRIAETQDVLTKSLMANDLVHRLNNAGGAIPIWSELISDELTKDEPSWQAINEYNTHVKDDIKKLLLTVKELQYSEKNTTIDIALMLNILSTHLQLQFHDEIKSNKLIITTQIEKELYTVHGLSSNVHNAIYNILSNGVDAILEKGYGELKISSKYISKESIEIKIEDTGIGISSENSRKIFTPYFTTKKNGTGYGLWRTKFIIEKMGGQIIMKSQKNRGSTFVITIPTAEYKEN